MAEREREALSEPRTDGAQGPEADVLPRAWPDWEGYSLETLTAFLDE